MSDSSKIKWSGKTGGNKWMQKSLILLFKIINIRILYFIMALVIPFYMIFNRKGYMSIYMYFRHRYSYSPFKSFVNVYLNHFTFGRVILDRFAFYSGKRFNINIIGNEKYEELINGENGFLMLSSHVGNYELAGYHLKAKNKSIYALIYGGETETVMKNRNKMFEGHNINMIPVTSDMSHLFEINNALREGNIVSMPGDRIFGSTKYLDLMFLGENAKFPLGPFAIAAQREVPILSVFVMKESTNNYTIYVKRIDSTATNRKERIDFMAKQFVSNLEEVILKYPKQWFNYYNFWE